MKFYFCEHCGNVITRLSSSGVPVQCCGQEMVLLKAGEKDAAREKHVPVVTREGDQVRVSVGEITHPMTEEHLISWIALETETGAAIQWLKPGQIPQAVYVLAEGQTPRAVYAYCNLHGLWKAEL